MAVDSGEVVKIFIDVEVFMEIVVVGQLDKIKLPMRLSLPPQF